MTKKITLAFFICVFIASSSWADQSAGSETRFVDYPTLAWIKGNGVRLRESPSTSSKILGKLNENDFVIVLDSKKVDGNLWYEVDHPTKKGRAYVYGQYLVPCFTKANQRDKLQKLFSSLEMTYGMNVQKAVALFGKPDKRTSRKSDYSDYQRTTLDWGTHNVSYIDGDLLVAIEVKRGNTPFGNIRIGDSTEKLIRELGKPETDNGNSFEYVIETDYGEGISEYYLATFTIKNGKIIRMYFENPNDGSSQ